MAIFLNENTKVIVQGMTGSEGTKHTRRMIASGTKIVGGVTPGKVVKPLRLKVSLCRFLTLLQRR